MIAEIVQFIFKGLQYQPLCFSFPPTCRRLVKRISVNFALLCLSDIMIKILKESQFTVESGSLDLKFESDYDVNEI